MELRIKIATLNNGEKRYNVQQAHLKITGGWIQRQAIIWEDIFKNILTEEEAIDAAKSYRSYYEKKKLEEVNSVTYKEI
jgi:hypothetical protein